MASAPTSAVPAAGDHDDDSEWEYEYSATETETYYVTLDLSKADFVTRQQSSVPSGRGGYKERALADIFARKYDDDNLPAPKPKPSHPGRDPLDEPKGPQADSQDKLSYHDVVDLNEFQILELHSENPLVSYRGRVYEGHWAQNVGTELLFARHDQDNPLPVVRRLDKGVDLLAASSARIMLTEKSLKPAATKSQRRQPKVRFDGEDYEGESHPTVPDPEPGASAERYEQGDFLAKLIALKRKRGDKDEVTVIAKLHEEGKKKPGQKKPKPDQDEERPARGKGSGRGRGGGRPRGKARSRGRGRGRKLHFSKEESSDPDPTEKVSTPMDHKSTRVTPRRWSQLNNPDEDENQDN
ncbi:hypothetical protein BKA67DRAFT_243154 [Truncatella angustata]|uniref:Transcription factor TFIIIC triple barrel domain-containing protein n=1 Tax=Truncatella angustata TaxID=152316 RepID=A0A9P8ZYW9_9PEZI|nr:uncharacterized protein BKA67DRAFT_243154 [Truncatella angustata]KAH6655597.1 hypothetical protein BKA67DRAFT_243154 [Truncatella angustata]KAH8197793.1 hypothetical protein TruAng_008040 [Truncatella angustata]